MSSQEIPDIHLPQPSIWPLLLALSPVLIAIGIISTMIIGALGVILLLASVIGWTLENRAVAHDEELAHD